MAHRAIEDLTGFDDPGNLLGSGAFGKVHQVTWRKTPAAAKVAHSSMPKEQKDLFLRELELMVRCRHPNIVQFLGYVDSPFVIVMEVAFSGMHAHGAEHDADPCTVSVQTAV